MREAKNESVFRSKAAMRRRQGSHFFKVYPRSEGTLETSRKGEGRNEVKDPRGCVTGPM
jgi:hypothetical protein